MGSRPEGHTRLDIDDDFLPRCYLDPGRFYDDPPSHPGGLEDSLSAPHPVLIGDEVNLRVRWANPGVEFPYGR